MAVITAGKIWANGDQLTVANLNSLFTSATLATGAVDDSSTTLSSGSLIVKDLGISTAKLAANAVTAGKMATTQDWSAFTITLPSSVVAAGNIASDAVTTAKILDDNVTYAKVDVATQAELEAETSAGVATPDVLKYHPGVAKAYGTVEFSNGDFAVSNTYNVTSASESGATRTITLAVTMANTNYVVMLVNEDVVQTSAPFITAKTTTTFTIADTETTNKLVSFVVFGDLA